MGPALGLTLCVVGILLPAGQCQFSMEGLPITSFLPNNLNLNEMLRISQMANFWEAASNTAGHTAGATSGTTAPGALPFGGSTTLTNTGNTGRGGMADALLYAAAESQGLSLSDMARYLPLTMPPTSTSNSAGTNLNMGTPTNMRQQTMTRATTATGTMPTARGMNNAMMPGMNGVVGALTAMYGQETPLTAAQKNRVLQGIIYTGKTSKLKRVMAPMEAAERRQLEREGLGFNMVESMSYCTAPRNCNHNIMMIGCETEMPYTETSYYACQGCPRCRVESSSTSNLLRMMRMYGNMPGMARPSTTQNRGAFSSVFGNAALPQTPASLSPKPAPVAPASTPALLPRYPSIASRPPVPAAPSNAFPVARPSAPPAAALPSSPAVAPYPPAAPSAPSAPAVPSAPAAPPSAPPAAPSAPARLQMPKGPPPPGILKAMAKIRAGMTKEQVMQLMKNMGMQGSKTTPVKPPSSQTTGPKVPPRPPPQAQP